MLYHESERARILEEYVLLRGPIFVETGKSPVQLTSSNILWGDLRLDRQNDEISSLCNTNLSFLAPPLPRFFTSTLHIYFIESLHFCPTSQT